MNCACQSIEKDLPNETDFLRQYNLFGQRLQAFADMRGRMIDLLFRFLH